MFLILPARLQGGVKPNVNWGGDNLDCETARSRDLDPDLLARCEPCGPEPVAPKTQVRWAAGQDTLTAQVRNHKMMNGVKHNVKQYIFRNSVRA